MEAFTLIYTIYVHLVLAKPLIKIKTNVTLETLRKFQHVEFATYFQPDIKFSN